MEAALPSPNNIMLHEPCADDSVMLPVYTVERSPPRPCRTRRTPLSAALSNPPRHALAAVNRLGQGRNVRSAATLPNFPLAHIPPTLPLHRICTERHASEAVGEKAVTLRVAGPHAGDEDASSTTTGSSHARASTGNCVSWVPQTTSVQAYGPSREEGMDQLPGQRLSTCRVSRNCIIPPTRRPPASQCILCRPPHSISPSILCSHVILSFHGAYARTHTRTYIYLTSAFSATPHCRSQSLCALSPSSARKSTQFPSAWKYAAPRNGRWDMGWKGGQEEDGVGSHGRPPPRVQMRGCRRVQEGAGGCSAAGHRRPKRSAYTDAGNGPGRRSNTTAQYAHRRDNIIGDKKSAAEGGGGGQGASYKENSSVVP
ncbi:hypothetical protein B0H14DRAFT_2632157 [Mycena olivaceomarginata]|nr:hypothetical protein B0H14DRAFT_2632157 [Mycena olivaceomarginata]